jgi:hypothetical protein
VVKAYASNQLWISGFLMDMCGAALMLTALSQAPVRCLLPLIPAHSVRWLDRLWSLANGGAGLRCSAHCWLRSRNTLRFLPFLPQGGYERPRLDCHHASWSRHHR